MQKRKHLSEHVEHGGPRGEEGVDGVGGAEGQGFGREECREDVAGVLGEGQGEEGLVLEGEVGLGVAVGGQEGVDAGVEGCADGKRGPLDAGGVEPEEGGEDQVEADGRGGPVRLLRGLDGRAGAREAAVEEVVEVRGCPLAAYEAGADGGAEVRQGGELGGVLGEQGEPGEVELAQGETLQGSGRAREVGVDLDLSFHLDV